MFRPFLRRVAILPAILALVPVACRDAPTIAPPATASPDQVNASATPTSTVLTTAPNPSVIGQPVTLTAVVTYASGRPVPWGRVVFFEEADCIVQGAKWNSPKLAVSGGQAQFVVGTQLATSGAHRLCASYYDDLGTTFASSSGTVIQRVNRAPQTITFAAIADQVFGSQLVPLSAASTSGLPITFVSASPATCAVSANASVQLLGGGSCSITAQQAGDSTYLPAADVTQTFTIGAAPSAFSQLLSPVVPFGSVATLSGRLDFGTAPLPPTSIAFVTITVGNGIPVSTQLVNGGFVVHVATNTLAVASSPYTVSYRFDGSAALGYAPAMGQSTLTLVAAAQHITFPLLPSGLRFGDPPFVATATASSGLPVSYTAFGACTVQGATVTIVGGGRCDLTASQPGDANYAAATPVIASTTFTPATPSLQLTTGTFGFDGAPHAATVVVTGVGGAPVTTPLPDVQYNGSTAVPVNAGNYVVTATFAGNTDYFPIATPVTGTLVITKALQSITFPPIARRPLGASPFTLSATGGGSGNPVTFALSPASIGCTLSGANGATVTLVSTTPPGRSCWIVASQGGGPNHQPALSVTQGFAIGKGTPTVAWGDPAPVYYGTPLSAAQLDAAAWDVNGAPLQGGTFRYAPPIGTVAPAGQLTLSVVFSPSATDALQYTDAKGTARLQVIPQPLDLVVQDVTKVFGDPVPPFTFTVTGLVNGETPAVLGPPRWATTPPVTWLSSVGQYTIDLSVPGSPNYAIRGIRPGTLTIVPVSTTVTPVPPVVARPAVPGTTLTLTATVAPWRVADQSPLGSVEFLVDGVSVGSAPVVGGTAVLRNVPLPASNGVHVMQPIFRSSNANFGGAIGGRVKFEVYR